MGTPRVVKVDVEGGEWAVLRGMVRPATENEADDESPLVRRWPGEHERRAHVEARGDEDLRPLGQAQLRRANGVLGA